DCLLDYVDGDNVKRLNGLEDEGEYHPANRPLLSLDELTEVAGTEPLTKLSGWREQLTIYSQGPIDLTAAPPEILRLLPGLGDPGIQRFVTLRAGKDQILGTVDDPVFKNLSDIGSYLGLGERQFRELGGLISLKDQTMHITSIGHSANVLRQLEVIARKGGGNP